MDWAKKRKGFCKAIKRLNEISEKIKNLEFDTDKKYEIIVEKSKSISVNEETSNQKKILEKK